MPLTNTTTTTITTTNVNEGYQLIVDTQSNTQVVGNFVTDVSIQPYIADQIISFSAKNMRPGQRIHVFFDGILMDDYAAPGIQSSNDTSKYTSVVRVGAFGEGIYVGPDGKVAGQMMIPKVGGTIPVTEQYKRLNSVEYGSATVGQTQRPNPSFKTGDRVLEIADVENLDQGKDAITTRASSTFTASNLSVTKQIVTLTTVTPQLTYKNVTNTIITTTVFTNVTVTPDIYNITAYTWEPLAQGLTINTPNEEAGVYATSVDIYFEEGSQSNNGIALFLCETDNGYPDGSTILPFSYVWKANSEINANTSLPLSQRANIPTRFTFEAPVFLANRKEYAFIIHPDQNDPDFRVFTANLGNIDYTTGVQVSSQPALGTAFYGSTVKQWTALQTEYVKFKLNVAQFSTGQGSAYFENADHDFLTLFNIGYAGFNSDITPGDWVYQGAESYVVPNSGTLTVSSGSTTVTASQNTDFTSILSTGDIIAIKANGTTREYKTVTGITNNSVITVSSAFSVSNSSPTTFSFINVAKRGMVQYFDKVRQLLYVEDTTANFDEYSYVQIHRFNTTAPGTISDATYIAYANTAILYNPKVNAIVPEFAILTPPGTSLDFSFRGMSNSGIKDSTDTNLTLGYEKELFDYERVVKSKTQEGATKSLTVRADFKSDTAFLSPMIDMVKADTLVLRNLVDPIKSIYKEFYNTGFSRTKYVSKVVELADGQDAEDLQIILSAHRPANSDIQVWVKFVNGDDPESIQNKTWTPMKNNSRDLYSDPGNPDDFREFVYSVPFSYPLLSATGTITTNTTNTIVGTDTLFGEEIGEGWWLNMIPANSSYNEVSRKVVSVISNTSVVLDGTFNASYTSNGFFVVPPPTTAWMSQNTSIQITGTVTTSTTNNTIVGYSTTFAANTTGANAGQDSILLTDADTYFTPGERVYYSVPSGNAAVTGLTGNTWYYVKTSNTSAITLSTTNGGAAIDITPNATSTGYHGISKTNFTLELAKGDVIQIAGDQQQIISITNSTHLTVGTPWSSDTTGANAYTVTSAGVTYLNNDGSRYSTFKKFQIKIILQSDDSSKVPFIDNLRAMALQL